MRVKCSTYFLRNYIHFVTIVKNYKAFTTYTENKNIAFWSARILFPIYDYQFSCFYQLLIAYIYNYSIHGTMLPSIAFVRVFTAGVQLHRCDLYRQVKCVDTFSPLSFWCFPDIWWKNLRSLVYEYPYFNFLERWQFFSVSSILFIFHSVT